MEKLNYPLLCFDLPDGGVLGLLVGTSYRVIDKNIRNVKAALSEYLQRNYRKYNEYPYADMIAPKLKNIPVKIRPTFRDDVGAYTTQKELKVSVVAIYSETASLDYECYLPFIGTQFHYNEPKQLSNLVQHFASTYLNQQPPSTVYRYVMYGKPKLEVVQLKINENRTTSWGNQNYERELKVLNRLADLYPHNKALRSHMGTGPEAAWELEDKVNVLVEKIVGSKANVLLVGESGVGKTAVLTQSVKKIAARNKNQFDYTFWQIIAQRITASSTYLGEWQKTCENLVEELEVVNGVLWVVDFIQLLNVGGGRPEVSVAAFLMPYLEQGKLQLIGEVTPKGLESIRRFLPGFAELFQLISIEPLSEIGVFTVLDKYKEFVNQKYKISLEQEAIELSYRLLLRYYPYQSFPGKAIRFLEKCVNFAQNEGHTYVGRERVIQHFSMETGLPDLFLRDDKPLIQHDLAAFFESKIIGQPAAIQHLLQIIKVFKVGLNNPYKPIATMIFAGPTGVGKTASAQTLADYFFGMGQQRSPLIRIDMSEFQYAGQISRFIGSGREVGRLVKEVRERPFAVLLLDEVEKAHPAIFDALLTVLDEGSLVDAFGRVTNFRNTIVIMTTNLGASNQKSIGFGNNIPEEQNYLSALGKFFRPEFLNRIDAVVAFDSLGQEAIRRITLKELEDLKQREGFVKRKIKLQFSEAVIQHLATVGFDIKYGARLLQRTIDHELTQKISNWLTVNHTVENKTLLIDFDQKIMIKIQISSWSEFAFSLVSTTMTNPTYFCGTARLLRKGLV